MSRPDPVWAPGSFLATISVEERDQFLALGITRPLPPGRQMLVEGRRDTHVEVIRQGHVKVTTSVGGVPRLLAIRLPGDLVGEFAAFTGNGRSATVTTCGEVVSTVIKQAEFVQFVAQHPQVAAQITATVGRRLRWANERRSEFSAFPVHVRLARVLGEIAASCGEAVGDGLMIGVELSQTELATLVGAREDTVQRALRLLRERGLLRTGYRRIIVLDEPGLRGLAEAAEWQ
jgi:CRP-like cAMP-binding protein